MTYLTNEDLQNISGGSLKKMLNKIYQTYRIIKIRLLVELIFY